VPTKTVLKVGFLERDFERDHLAEKSNRGQKIHCVMANYQIGIPFIIIANLCNDNFNKFIIVIT
jgi:hypothetical protein